MICFCFPRRKCAVSSRIFRRRTGSRGWMTVGWSAGSLSLSGCAGEIAPRGYSPHKTIYNRFVRWSRCLGVFNKIFAELARKGGKPRRLMIDATLLKTHRTAASLLKMGLFPDVSAAVLTVNSIPLVQSRESGDALEDMLKLACAS